jgi:maleate isomerase
MADARLREIMETLLAQTTGDRTTLRLEGSDGLFAVVAEAVGDGAWAIAGDSSVDLRKAETVRWLMRERKPLIQDDLEDADPPVPRELIDVYGARAQMLGPLVKDDRLVGIISVHRLSGPGHWSDEEQSALAQACAAVEAAVGSEGVDQNP